jgi:hypothetical protein
MMLKIRSVPIILSALVMLALSACSVSLAPPFDQSLVTGLNSANTKALTLFSAVSTGSTAEKFPQYSSQYDGLIGQFGALRQQALARPIPPLAKKLADQLVKYKVLKEACGDAGGNPSSCVNSSPNGMLVIINNLTKMRDVHKASGLKKDIVAIFKNAHDISMSQALTIETALKRNPS